MSALDVLKFPARRDVKGLGTVLGEIEPPSRVTATFTVERYGTFVVNGDVVTSVSAGNLTLAGRFLEQNLKPDRALRLLAPVTPDSVRAADAVSAEAAADDAAEEDAADDAAEDAGTDAADGADDAVQVDDAEPVNDAVPVDDAVVPASDTNELRATVVALQHGDLVRAGFYVRTYGSFTITGMAVWNDVAAAFLVGGWFISGAQEQPAARLESLAVLARADEHGAPVPPRITGPVSEDDVSA